MKRSDLKILLLTAGMAVIAAAFAAVLFRMLPSEGSKRGKEKVIIAAPKSEWVQDYSTNYYTEWLEEKSGCEIEFVMLEEGYERESLNALLTSKYSGADAIFLPARQDIISDEDYRAYINSGRLAAPADYLAESSELSAIEKSGGAPDVDGLRGEDGKLYCFPSAQLSRSARKSQILWINIDWLKRLGLTVPRTTEEFAETLRAFRENDPNGNGLPDELPLVCCRADNSLKSSLFLINAFCYYDEDSLSLYAEDGKLLTGIEQDDFREGVRYCARLYGDGLIAADCFDYSQKQLSELVNDPADVVGAFSSHSIADIIYTNNPGVLAHFVQLAPLSSDVLEKGCGVATEVIPTIGGLIPESSKHKKEAAEIMDIMLSEEASLIALYGEENADWRFSGDGELSTYGTRAVITTLRYLKNDRQNKNFAGAGPLLASSEYSDGVTWNGDHSMTEYIDARAAKTYEEYYRAADERDRELLASALENIGNEKKSAAKKYLDSELTGFIRGEKNADDDGEWEDFLKGFKEVVGNI